MTTRTTQIVTLDGRVALIERDSKSGRITNAIHSDIEPSELEELLAEQDSALPSGDIVIERTTD